MKIRNQFDSLAFPCLKKYFSVFVLCFLSMLTESHAQMCLPTWRFRVPVTVNNSANPALTNYQVKLTINSAALIAAGKMRADGADIRFTTSDCCTPLCYFVQKGINTSSTVIWVKLPSLPAAGSATIYLHYGDLMAPNAENGDCVFEFFDDFNDGVINPAKWTIRGTNNVYSESAGVLNFAGNVSGNWGYIRSNTAFSSQVMVHDFRRHSGSFSSGMVFNYSGTDNRHCFRNNGANIGTIFDNNFDASTAYFNTTYPGVPYPTTSLNEFEISTLINPGNQIRILSYCNITTLNCNNTATDITTYSGTSFNVGYSGFANTGSAISDYIFVRKNTAIDPITSLGSEFNMPSRPMAVQPDTALCFGTSLLFDGGAGHFSYNWHNANTTQNSTANFPPDDTIWCQVTDGMGCIFRDTVIVSTMALPANFITPASVAVCPGDTALFDAGAGFNSYLWNTLDSTQSIQALIPNLYSATVTDSFGCTGTDSATLSNFIPVVPLINPDNYNLCPGDSVSLDAGFGFLSYFWSTQDSAQFTLIDSAGSYIVTVMDSNNCSSSDTSTVAAVPNPVVNITPNNITECEGTSVCLDAGNGFSCYMWNNGAATQQICFLPAGIYSVTVCDANNCLASDTAEVQFFPFVNASVTQNGDTLISSQALTYQWLLNSNSIIGATNQSYLPSANGDYAVVVTDSNGCTDTSNVISFVVGSAVNMFAGIKTYPNPVSQIMFLDFSQSISTSVKWEVHSVYGQLLFNGELIPGLNPSSINLSSLSKGIYYLKIFQGGKEMVHRFVKD